MNTRTDCFAPAMDWSNPWARWEAAARWNAMLFEWATKGWSQWLQLATALPSRPAPHGQPEPGAGTVAARANQPAPVSRARPQVKQPRAVIARNPQQQPRRAARASAEAGRARPATKRPAAARARPRS